LKYLRRIASSTPPMQSNLMGHALTACLRTCLNFFSCPREPTSLCRVNDLLRRPDARPSANHRTPSFPLGRSTMLDALNRAEPCRDLANECRRLAATSFSRQMRKRYSRMAKRYSLLAEVEQFVRSVFVAVAILGAVSSGVAVAEAATPSPSTSIIDDV